ncbi:MAG: GGDEF domain-containing phosphodiesterase [Lachnospiraceae bacterium]|nr:GGDEF domain-containing phosphodiesterase [Lachnospiraceae bacterium]
MTRDNQDLYLQFLREIALGDGDLNMLTEALSGVAYYYHISAIEAELLGDHRLDQKEITLFERENADPVGEPVKYVFESNNGPAIVIYVYADEKPFNEEEKEELEIYATNCCFALQKYQMARFMKLARDRQFNTWLLNVDGFLKQVTLMMNTGYKLSEYSAFCFNIKQFTDVNKRYGRKKGNEVLAGYGKSINDRLKEDELVGHLGGDNFIALVKRSGQKDLLKYLEDVRVRIEVDGKKEDVHLAAYVGVWEIDDDNTDIEALIGKALVGLNQARKKHIGQVLVTDFMIGQMKSLKEVLEHYEEALKTKEFSIFYQPKVDSRTNTLVGAEGLVRWFRGDKMISPGIFIPALEDNGTIKELDYYVLRQACEDIKEWVDKGYEPVPVSVNFSRRDLKDRKLAWNINKIIEEAGIDKSLIEIELTETVDADEHGELSKFIDELYKMNIKTAIDDFGAGYSSLATLREFSVHSLKLDRSFVNTDDFSWKDEIILKDIIHMAGELSMDVLCEGVERVDQLALLNSVSCYVIQGYYYDKPLKRDEYEERLKNKKYKK